jgi:outer membrane murein-binding lipoprotein Lpp
MKAISGVVLANAGCVGMLTEDTEKKERIVETYSSGIDNLNDGYDDWEAATNYWNSEKWSDAERLYGDSKTVFEDAIGRFENAVELCYEVENSEARKICEDAETHASRYAQASEDMERAAGELDAGNRDSARDYHERAKDDVNQARGINVRDTEVLATALGLSD